MAAQWVRSWNAVVWQFSCSWCKAAAGCKNTAQRVGKRVRNYSVWESKGTHRFFRRNLLTWDRKLITCDRNLLTCERNLLTCDRSLLTCDRSLLTCDRNLLTCDRNLLTGDRNLHAICGPRGVSAFCACVTFCKKKKMADNDVEEVSSCLFVVFWAYWFSGY